MDQADHSATDLPEIVHPQEVAELPPKSRRFLGYFVYWKPKGHPCIAEHIRVFRDTPQEKRVMYPTRIALPDQLYRRMYADPGLTAKLTEFASALGHEAMKTVRAKVGYGATHRGTHITQVSFSFRLHGLAHSFTIDPANIPEAVLDVLKNDPQHEKNPVYTKWYWKQAAKFRETAISAEILKKYL